jgi:hypothetical protein
LPGADTVATNETVDPAVTGCAGAFRLRPIVSANVREESSKVAARTNGANIESVRTAFFIIVIFLKVPNFVMTQIVKSSKPIADRLG